MAKKKFKHNDVVVLINPKNHWGKYYGEYFHGEIGLVVRHAYGEMYKVKHIHHVNGIVRLYSIDESEMIKIGVL